MNKKHLRDKGKLQLSRYFQELKKGDSVAVIREGSVASSFPLRIQGKTGVIEGKRGRSYMVNIKEYDKEKRFIIAPIHLKKIKNVK